jgi:hypothetical protein
MKVLYLVAMQHRPNRANLTGKINGWKHILNALTIHYGDRITAATHQNDHSHLYKESDSPRDDGGEHQASSSMAGRRVRLFGSGPIETVRFP